MTIPEVPGALLMWRVGRWNTAPFHCVVSGHTVNSAITKQFNTYYSRRYIYVILDVKLGHKVTLNLRSLRYAVCCPLSECRDVEFSCDNGRCISPDLKCDGADDCGDNSDEWAACSMYLKYRRRTCFFFV